MDIYTGEFLAQQLAALAEKQYKKRHCFHKIMEFMRAPSTPRVMALYGLRRTGKTVLMEQVLLELSHIEQSCFILCEYGDTMRDLKEALNAHSSCKYFVLDEVTQLDDFVNTASTLADRFASLGKKILMAGTDSLCFAKAAEDSLFDRVEMIHTTYIPFREYNYLLGKSLDDYIMYGGTLTDGYAYYNKEKNESYTNSAIAKNIQHSLKQVDRDGEFGALWPYYDQDELTTFINKQVEIQNHRFLLRTIRQRFKSHDLGALRQYVEAKDITDSAPLYNPKLLDEIQSALEIKEPFITKPSEAAIEQAQAYLERLDVLYNLPGSDEVIFTQPGLRYWQVERLVEILQKSSALDTYLPSLRNTLSKIIMADVKGRLMEEIIFYQMLTDPRVQRDYEVQKYRTPAGDHEFDMVLFHQRKAEAILFEIKHSRAFAPEGQVRHLLSADATASFLKKFPVKIIGKCVLYMGKSETKFKDVLYINAENFMLHPCGCIKKVQRHFSSVFQTSVLKEK